MLKKLRGSWRALAQRIGLAQRAGQSPVHAALIAAARELAEDAIPAVPADQALDAASLVVFDLETTGLDTNQDSVLAIGAVKINGLAIVLGQTFERLLSSPAELNSESQLLHGLTREDLAAGDLPRSCLLDFLDYSQGRIWLAYHAPFDRIMLQNAMQTWLGIKFDALPMDLAALTPMIFPDKGPANAPLDHWLSTFSLSVAHRHNALADAMATAELLLIVLDRAWGLGYRTWGELDDACKQWQEVQRYLSVR